MEIQEQYNTILKEKLIECKIDNIDSNHIINYLYTNNDKNTFSQKMYDIFIALDLDNKRYIIELLNDVEKLNTSTTYDLSPYVNENVLETIKIRQDTKFDDLDEYTSDFTCSKCKFKKTKTIFIHKRLGADEPSSLKIICIKCSHTWYG